ncbi:MAG: EAL domain-containing response regulator [Sedimenticolaceae bacterium]
MNKAASEAMVLLVDDETFFLQILQRQLANLGLTNVRSFQDAGEALVKLESDSSAFDLVICDLQMPNMDGVEFVRHLARIRFQGAVLLVSGEDTRILQTAERLAQAQKLNVLGALQKPTTPDQLRELLEQPAAAVAPLGAGGVNFGVEEVRQAIDCGELVNHYQPKVSMASGELVGVETLVRWQHPTAGLVLPHRFIDTAEQHGLIESLTDVVMAGALHDLRQWLDGGVDLHLAVNVSMDSLADLDFVEKVTQLASDAGVTLQRLVIEVTESRLMRDPVALADILTRLRLRHVGVSIDDFGTGHSSLSKLRDIPFNELKIDRSFAHGAVRNAALRSIVQASLDMARQLGIHSVAEGIEDLDDWNFLRAAGCDVAQGFFIGRPMPAEQLFHWIEDWVKRRPPS